jgi:hypothetical protein
MKVARTLVCAFAIVACIAASTSAAFACTSVIRNHSSSPWTITYYMHTGTFTSTDCPVSYDEPRPCTVSPGGEVTFAFHPDGDYLAGDVANTTAVPVWSR